MQEAIIIFTLGGNILFYVGGNRPGPPSMLLAICPLLKSHILIKPSRPLEAATEEEEEGGRKKEEEKEGREGAQS